MTNSEKSKQGRNNKRKGAKYMNYVRRALSVIWPRAIVRSQSRGAKKEGCDVENTGYLLEVKNQKSLSLPAWWRKLLEEKKGSGDDRPPALAFKVQLGSNRIDHLVAISLEEFVELQRWRHGMGIEPSEYGYNGLKAHHVFNDNFSDCRGFGLILEHKQSDGVIKFEAGLWDWERDYHDKWNTVTNPDSRSNGLWSNMEDAEAAIRRAVE